MIKYTIVAMLLVGFVSGKSLTSDPHIGGHKFRTSQPANNMPESNKSPPPNPIEMDPNYWIEMARAKVLERDNETLNKNKAKNVIFFLGDGMSLNTITAARILKGQRKQRTGEEEVLFFEKFPYTGLSKTYCLNAQVADSSCTATAYLTGVKSNYFMLGLSGNVNVFNCTAAKDPVNHLSSIAQWAQAAGKSTGFITTTTLTHASPGGAYAHAAHRLYECDTDIMKYKQGDFNTADCVDIATQLITQEPGRHFDVMLGGGMGKFLPNTMMDLHGNSGERSDGVNLLSKWQAQHTDGVLVSNRDELLQMNITQIKSVIGLFDSGVMDFHRLADETKQPSLAEMTEVALKMLSKNENGYFIFIEGGLIDYGNHFNVPGLSLDETLELEKAIKVAREMTSEDDTLIVLTADHAHPLTISGYPDRGNDILNLNEADVDSNGVKYTTLQYSVGLEQYLDNEGNRIDLTGQINSDLFTFPSYVKSFIGVHGGDDVGIFASGPYAHLFRGSLEQNTIPHMMAYASCIGDGPTMCSEHQQ